jgi:hypothetical protein
MDLQQRFEHDGDLLEANVKQLSFEQAKEMHWKMILAT